MVSDYQKLQKKWRTHNHYAGFLGVPGEKIEIHHIKQRAHGGSDNGSNLVELAKRVHRGKPGIFGLSVHGKYAKRKRKKTQNELKKSKDFSQYF